MAFPPSSGERRLVNEGLPQVGAIQNATLLGWPQTCHVAVVNEKVIGKRKILVGMGFLKRLKVDRLVVGGLIGGGLMAAPGVVGAWTFDQTLGVWRDQSTPAVASPSEAKPRPESVHAKTKALPPTPMVERTPTNVEIVNKALNPGASDPDVPLPRADLSDAPGNEPSTASGSGPRIFGRGEDGGGVLGLRVPIPADRNASGATARYGTAQASQEPANEARER
jgi:hypothetical protein